VRAPLSGPPSPLRLHQGGEFRRRLAAAFGREESEADELWRRIIHGAGAFVLLYDVLPSNFFVVVPKVVVLLAALAAVLVLEVLRLGLGAELPTIRGYEARRPASYVFYAVALAGAVLFLPPPLAAAVVLGTAFVDPLAGELRRSDRWRRPGPFVAFAAYTVLAAGALGLVGRWPWAGAVGLGALAAAVAVVVERWRFRWLDDDLTMTVAPALVLYGLGVVVLGLPR
jgi:hypothetical protein